MATIRVVVGDRRRRLARAARHADRRARGRQLHVGLHRHRRLSDAARASLDRPHVAQRRPGPAGDRHRDGRGRERATSSRTTSTARWSTTRRSWRTTASARGSTGDGRRRRSPRTACSPTSSSCRTKRRSGSRPSACATARSSSRRIEATPVTQDGRIVDLKVVHKNRARDLIEDFMIASNVAIAKFLEAQGRSGIRRVVREPERWARIVELAGRYGDDASRRAGFARARAFPRRRGARPIPIAFPTSRSSIVKLMGPGIYALDLPGKDPGGHFGLATHDYSHATAPNRRYADLVTQRLVKAALAKAPAPYSNDELAAIAAALHRARRRGEQGRAHGAEDGRGAAAARSHRRDLRRHRDWREREGNVRPHHQAAGRRDGGSRPRGLRRRRQGAGQARGRRSESRVHRFRGPGRTLKFSNVRRLRSLSALAGSTFHARTEFGDVSNT